MPVFAHGGLSSDHSRLYQTASTRVRLRPMNGRPLAFPRAGGLPLPSNFSSCPEPPERQPAKTRYSAKEWPQLPAGCRGRGVSRGVLLKRTFIISPVLIRSRKLPFSSPWPCLNTLKRQQSDRRAERGVLKLRIGVRERPVWPNGESATNAR